MTMMTFNFDEDVATYLKSKKLENGIKEYIQKLIREEMRLKRIKKISEDVGKGYELGGKFNRDEAYDRN